MTLIIALATGQLVIVKKLKAQSLCVKSAMTLQTDLARILEELLRLNPEASRLRTERMIAEARLAAALVSTNAYAIAVAKAYRTSVILRQAALRTRQKYLITKSEAALLRQTRAIKLEARKLRIPHVTRIDHDRRALAVSAHPASSPSPNYQVDPPFSKLQTKFFSMDVPLNPSITKLRWKQNTTCGTTLNQKEQKWRPQIVRASALSKRLWSLPSL